MFRGPRLSCLVPPHSQIWAQREALVSSGCALASLAVAREEAMAEEADYERASNATNPTMSEVGSNATVVSRLSFAVYNIDIYVYVVHIISYIIGIKMYVLISVCLLRGVESVLCAGFSLCSVHALVCFIYSL